MEYGAARCSAKCTTASGARASSLLSEMKSYSVMSPEEELDVLSGYSVSRSGRRSGHRPYRRQRLHAQFMIPLAARKVIDDRNLMAFLRKIPSAVAQPQYPSPPNTHIFIRFLFDTLLILIPDEIPSLMRAGYLLRG